MEELGKMIADLIARASSRPFIGFLIVLWSIASLPAFAWYFIVVYGIYSINYMVPKVAGITEPDNPIIDKSKIIGADGKFRESEIRTSDQRTSI